MLRSNYSEAISHAVAQINGIIALEDLDLSRVKLGVVLCLLNAAGWDVLDVSQVIPDYPIGNGKVDLALMSSHSRRPGGSETPLVLVCVKPFGDNLESGRYERRLVAQCVREGAPLAAITNGRRWLLLFQPSEGNLSEHRFCEIDLAGDPETAAENLNRYLSRDRIVNGQAARSAERALRDRNSNAVTRQAVLDGWRQVVLGLDDGLMELVATAAEQRTGHRPENRLVRRVLTGKRAELLPRTENDGDLPGADRSTTRRSPASFTFLSETRPVSTWSDLLVGVCLMMRERQPGDFERILEIRGRKLPFFSRSVEEVYLARPIGDSGIYASCRGAGALLERRARQVVEFFGYPADTLTVQGRQDM